MLQIISASRRTDLPRVFPGLLASWLKQGWVKVRNPFNQKEKLVSLQPAEVHTLVLWSKDYSAVIANQAGLKDLIKNYQQTYIHFTITGFGGSRIEPGILGYKEAMKQVEPIIKIVGNPERINWRFDPIIFYKEEKIKSNIRLFEEMAAELSKTGIRTAVFSFVAWYQKVKSRVQKNNFRWQIVSKSRIKKISEILLEKSKKYGINLSACCTPEATLNGITQAKCINGRLFSELHPEHYSLAESKDSGQRNACGCTKAVDIGDYSLRCPAGCVYCYANPN